jgi:hypothetical protein
LVVKKGDDAGDFIGRQAESGHALIWAAIPDHGAEEIAIHVVPQDGGADQARSLSAAVRCGAVAKGAGLFELLLSECSRGLSSEDERLREKNENHQL